MAYYIYADDVCIHDPYMLVGFGKSTLSPKLTLETNKAGSLTFTLPPNNVAYNTLSKLTTTIRVFRDNDLLFKGRVINDERDFQKRKQIYCEGMLSYLVDSNMRPYDNSWTVEQFFNAIITNHNRCVDSTKQFTVGIVDVSTQEAIQRTNGEYTQSLDLIRTELLEKYGGFVRTREVNGTNYIDYIAAYSQVASQTIEFGKNLLDLTEYLSAENVFTVLIPLGAQVEGTDGVKSGRLTISSVNNGKDYLENQNGINLFGRIERTQVWDDVSSPDILKSFGELVLDTGVNPDLKLSINAVDLSLAENNEVPFELGDYVRMISVPHGVDTLFQVTKIEYDIARPDQSTYEFESNWYNIPTLNTRKRASGIVTSVSNTGHNLNSGGSYSSMSAQTVNVQRQIVKNEADAVIEYNRSIEQSNTNATARATDVINAGFGGYVYIKPDEIYIMNTDSIETATKVWRWNVGGLGYWSGTAGGGAAPNAYTVAMTQDGEIVADFITTGTLDAQRITTGTITADKIEDATGTDWLAKLNSMLQYATAQGNNPGMKIGDATAYGYSQSITFALTDSQYIRFYPTPTVVNNIGSVFCELQYKVGNTLTHTYIHLPSGSTGDVKFTTV